MLHQTMRTAGPGDSIMGRWTFHALPHQIQYDVVQSPIHPFQIKAAAAPPAGAQVVIMVVGV